MISSNLNLINDIKSILPTLEIQYKYENMVLKINLFNLDSNTNFVNIITK